MFGDGGQTAEGVIISRWHKLRTCKIKNKKQPKYKWQLYTSYKNMLKYVDVSAERLR